MYIQYISVCIFNIAPCTHGSVLILNHNGQPTTSDEGIVSLCVNGTWTAVCDFNWNYKEASVACSAAGYSSYGK